MDDLPKYRANNETPDPGYTSPPFMATESATQEVNFQMFRRWDSNSNIHANRKLIIALLLCSGLFVICAAIIRVVLTLGSNPSALNINRR
jgi:hypothetical protein